MKMKVSRLLAVTLFTPNRIVRSSFPCKTGFGQESHGNSFKILWDSVQGRMEWELQLWEKPGIPLELPTPNLLLFPNLNSSLLPRPIPWNSQKFLAHLGGVEAGAEGVGQAPVIHGWGGNKSQGIPRKSQGIPQDIHSRNCHKFLKKPPRNSWELRGGNSQEF